VRALGTAESLENSPALSVESVSRLRAIADEFNGRSDLDEAAFEDFTAQCQAAITKERLHISNVVPVTR
jgi:hypothetical protein